MPIEVIKYTCQFKCGKRSVGEKLTMQRHETTCWNNPQNQTCKTCSNEIYEHDRDEYNNWVSRGCKISSIDEVLTNVEPILKYQNTYHVRPIYNCPYWNKKDDENSQSFADILEAEIKSKEEGTEHYPFYNKPVES